MALVLTILAVFAVVVGSEFWWRLRRVHGEFSRKFVHITVGSFVAFWPYWLTVTEIKALSVAFVIVVGISRYAGIFKAIHSVQRPTYGEVWFALAVGAMAFIAGQHPHIYTAALLEMSLADGLAAVIGVRFGNAHRYSVLGTTKSLVGTVTFFLSSCLILGGYGLVVTSTSVALIVLVSLAATVIENVAPWGADNAAVPLFVAGMLLLIK